MEKLVINVPEKKSTLVKQILLGLGVTIQGATVATENHYKEKLAGVSVWSDDEIAVFEETRRSQRFCGIKKPSCA